MWGAGVSQSWGPDSAWSFSGKAGHHRTDLHFAVSLHPVLEFIISSDEARKQRDVAEITETEYFRQLLIKVEELKHRQHR